MRQIPCSRQCSRILPNDRLHREPICDLNSRAGDNIIGAQCHRKKLETSVGRVRLTRSEARRIALAAQGLDRSRPATDPDARHFRRVLNTLGLLQLDYVNVLVPAHFLVLWSRLGDYDRERFERFVYGRREFTEQWAHEASIVPCDAWPLLAFRRSDYQMHPHNPLRRLRGRQAYLDSVIEQVERDGALTASELPPVPGPKRKAGDWHRSIPRWALEYHFARGDLAVSRRLSNFQRVYDLPTRVIPPRHLERELSGDEARLELLRRASRALGISTLHDLADYYRMSPRTASPLVERMLQSGELSAVRVEGWAEPAYLAAGARLPRAIGGASLLSPFDPAVWFRPRAERLFDFHYRIEIYVPAARRRWGYYVLPFRVGDRIVARVDLKADRQARRLRVLNAHEEANIDAGHCCRCLAAELDALGTWLGLDGIEVEARNRFSSRLARAVQ